MKILNGILIAAGIVVLFGVVISWSDAHDKAQQAAYEKYDKCVILQYGETAAAFYQANGYAPECE